MKTKYACRGVHVLLVLGIVALQVGCSASNAPFTSSPFASAPPVEQRFVAAAITWDLSRDGDVTCAEWKQYATSLFREADADHNGALSRDEFAAMAQRDRLFESAGFAYLDRQKDGRVVLAEMVDKPNPAFTLLDANKDCTITVEERSRPQSAKSKGIFGL